MSSEVQAKWMNSAAAATSACPAKRSFSQYSIALTSWLVRDSISFTRAASDSAKSVTAWRSSATAAAEKGRTSGRAGSSARAISHSISTRTR